MKKIIFIAMLAIAAFSSRQTLMAQVTFEHTYDTASVFGYHGNSMLYIITLEVEGQKYIKINRTTNQIQLYNLDHSLFKIMTIPVFTDTDTTTFFNILYVSEHLFNLDNLIEYMVVYVENHDAQQGNNWYHTKIVNELNSVIFSADSCAPECLASSPEFQLPIYNTTNGTKMILSFRSSADAYLNTCYANVYSLGGTLTNSIATGIHTYNNNPTMSVFPNPSNGNNTTIEFNLPQGENRGEIVIYNVQGMELKKYQVDNTFNDLIINNSDLHSGTYFYQLLTNKQATGAKKMIIVR